MSIDVNVQNDLVIVTETTEDIVVNVSNAAGPQGPAGANGVGVPVGGTTGQVLKKFTNTNYDTYWAADGQGVPYSGATGDVNLGEFQLTAGQLTLDTSPTGTAAIATTRWNDTTGVSETTLKGGSVILKNGVDLVARVVNKVFPNATLTKAAYQAVRVSGAQGQRLAVAYAQANNDANSADTIGLVCETIPTNQEGFIITVGQIENINTTGSLQGETWVDGDVLYLSPTTAGAITKVKPTGNGHIVIIGYVEYAHVNNGKIYVKVMNGWELDELHDVSIVSAANNEALIYESSTALWKNKTIAAALGFTPVTNARLINTTSPLVGGGDLSADRTLSIPAATSSVNGYLTSTDWTTFNNKQNTLTNPVTGTGTTNFLPKWTSGSAIGNSQVFDNGTSVGINNASPSSSWVLDINANNSTYNTRLYQPSTSTSAYNSLVISGAMTSAMGYFGIGGSATGNTAFRNAVVIGSQTANPLVFNTSDTERARITAAGRLLLGTTTESTFLLDVNGTARVSGQITGNSFVPTSSTIPTNGMYLPSANTLGFATASTLDMTLNASGNLGLGQPPSAWISTSKALQIGVDFPIVSLSQQSNGATNLGSNIFENASNAYRYIASAFAGRYELNPNNGFHYWYTAPSGTAGNAITFTQAMTLTNGGNLLVGGTSDNGSRLQITGDATFSSGIKVNGTSMPSVTNSKLLVVQTAATADFVVGFKGGTTTGSSYGLLMQAGTNSSDVTLLIRDSSNTNDYFKIRGDGASSFSSSVTASSFIKSGGTSSQYLMADGSVTTGGGGSVDELQVSLICQVFG